MEEEKSQTSHKSGKSEQSYSEAYQDLKPIPEERSFAIEVVESVQEGSQFKSESDEVNDEDLQDLLSDEDQEKANDISDQDENGMQQEILADEGSVIDKFITDIKSTEGKPLRSFFKR